MAESFWRLEQSREVPSSWERGSLPPAQRALVPPPRRETEEPWLLLPLLKDVSEPGLSATSSLQTWGRQRHLWCRATVAATARQRDSGVGGPESRVHVAHMCEHHTTCEHVDKRVWPCA